MKIQLKCPITSEIKTVEKNSIQHIVMVREAFRISGDMDMVLFYNKKIERAIFKNIK